MGNINQRLNGYNPLSYLGDNAYQPPEFVSHPRPPDINDSKNFLLGTIWLDISGYPASLPTANDVYMLVALVGNQAEWISFGGGDVETLTGNSGGPVGPDGAFNINVVGVGVITVVGNPGTNTLTITPSGDIASSFPTDSGTATPAAGVLNIIADNATVHCGSSVLFSAPGSSNIVQLNVTDADGNTIIGELAGNLTLTSSNTTILGGSSGSSLTSSPDNTIIGEGSGTSLAGGLGANTFVGQGVATSLVSGASNLVIGQGSGANLTGAETKNVLINGTGVTGLNDFFSVNLGLAGPTTFSIHNFPAGNAVNGSNVFIGGGAGNYTMANNAIANTGIGQLSLSSTTSGSGNTMCGEVSGVAITSGTSNTGYGVSTFFNTGSVTGLTTGAGNIAIGYNAAGDYTGAESYNIIIGGPGVVGESNHLRIGFIPGNALTQSFIEGIRGITPVNNNAFVVAIDSAGQLAAAQAKSFISGVRGVTTDVNDAIPVLIDSAGQLGTTSSSKRYKENIKEMADDSDFLYNLRPVTFNFKKDDSKSKQYGLIAEEVEMQEPRMVVHGKDGVETVKYHDLPVLLLNELQKLERRCKEMERRLDSFEKFIN